MASEIEYAKSFISPNKVPKFWWNDHLTRLFRKQSAATKKAKNIQVIVTYKKQVC